MKFSSEYRDAGRTKILAEKIFSAARGRKMTFMEVCGTHTMAIARFGIKKLLPPSIRLVSGPGCPVCVTPNEYLDYALALAAAPNTIICTFGDMVRVPGSLSSLEKERAAGRDIRIVYSTLDALEAARKNPKFEIVFLGVGFETTAPMIAASIATAKKEGLSNYSVLCSHKTVPPALEALIGGDLNIDGFLLPGHVSTIIGAAAYRKIFEKNSIAGAIAGFEPTDILESILELAAQISENKPRIHTSYSRAVTEDGNKKAMSLLGQIFEKCDAKWRGLGVIPGSGLKIRDDYNKYDSEKKFRLKVPPSTEPKGCRCGEILSGKISPPECPLFGKDCRPENPIGACMVSGEGTCAAYFKYGNE